MLGWTKILLGRQVDPAMLTRALQVIDRNAVAQTRLIDDMLDMARIMSGKLRLELAAGRSRRDRAGRRSTSSRRPPRRAASRSSGTFEVAAPWMMGDADRVQQIIWNLLSNAVKFTEAGGRVTVGIVRERDVLTLYVEDTGRGHRRRTSCRRCSSASARPTPRRAAATAGSGLGLSLVRQLVELHGGRVSATSEVGRAAAASRSRFPAAPRSTTTIRSTPAAVARASLDLDGVRVLLIEDDADAREILATALRHHGADGHRSGLGRVRRWKRWMRRSPPRPPPDVIISDIGLPDEDGYHVDGAARQPRPPRTATDIPVIAVTAYGRPQDKRQALAAGFRMHLTKPIDARRARRRRRASSAARPHEPQNLEPPSNRREPLEPRTLEPHQMSPTVKPSGNGSCGSTTYCAKPVIQACPPSSGTTAR